MRLTSPAFEHGGPIPKKYTEDGQNISPPLIFEDVPPTARTLAIIVDDPDAPRHDPWVHWVLYNVPAQVQHLPEAIPRHEDLSQPIAAQQGINSWPRHNVGYRGQHHPKDTAPITTTSGYTRWMTTSRSQAASSKMPSCAQWRDASSARPNSSAHTPAGELPSRPARPIGANFAWQRHHLTHSLIDDSPEKFANQSNLRTVPKTHALGDICHDNC